jgi:hypothetical protein
MAKGSLSPEVTIHSFSMCGIITDDPKTIHCIREDIVPEAEGLILGENSVMKKIQRLLENLMKKLKKTKMLKLTLAEFLHLQRRCTDT